MRYRVKDYTVQPIAGGVWLYFTAPEGVELSSDPDNEIEPFIQEAIRLVIDESDGIVLCSSMQKRVYLMKARCTPATREIRLQFAVPEGTTVSSTDVFTIEMDWGDEPTGLSGGDDAHNLAQFFGLPQALPEYHAMTEAEVLEIADEEWQAMYGFVAVPNTVHTVDVSESERVFTTYMNPNKTYADYGWPALWDAQGVTIELTDHPTAGRVIYTFNPSNND